MYWNSFTYFKNTVRNCVEKYFFDNPLTDQTVGKSTFIEGVNVMPELPEVETVRRTLLQLVNGKTIDKVTVLWPKIIKKPEETEQFCDALRGQTIYDVDRRGKFLKFILDDYVMVSHLRMEDRKSTRLNSSHVKISYAV